MIPGSATPFFLAKSDGDFKIERSLRFNDDDSSSLSRTISSSGNLKTYTLSMWVKRSKLGYLYSMLYSTNGTNGIYYSFKNTDKLEFADYYGGSYQFQLVTSRVFRDTAAWYHIVVAVDTTQVTASDRIKIYINGVQETTFDTSNYPAQNYEGSLNRASIVEYLGDMPAGDGFNGYIADVYLVDGQALAASDFGKYDDNNVWQPKAYNGGFADWFDQSQTWSDLWSTTGTTYGSAAALHDATISTSSYFQIDQSGTFTLPSALPVTSLRFYTQVYGTGGTVSVNGTDVTSQLQSSGIAWSDITGFTSLSSISVTGNQDGSNLIGWYAIELNGKLLIDSGITGIANNSFHLNFSDNSNNAALGTDSSGNDNTWTVNNITAQGADYTGDSVLTGSIYSNAGSISNLFDGTDTGVGPNQSSYITFTPSTPITINSSLKVKGNVSNASVDAIFAINGSDVSTVSEGFPAASGITQTSTTWTTISNPPSSLTSLKFGWATTGSWMSVSGIEIDGVVLRDIPFSNIDSLIDTPMDYESGSGNNGGNYCTLSPLKNAQTLSNGNLDVVGGSSWQRSVGTIGMYSGKYYWEYTVTASNEHIIGVGPPDMQLSGNLGAGSPPGSGYGTELGQVNGTGANGSWSNTGASGAGDIIGIAFDADNGNMYVYKNGTALNSGTASHTGLVMPQIPVVSLNGSSRSGTINFGQRPFAYTPPTGYKSLCTTNLPEPTIGDGSTAMDIALWTGNGSARSISGLSFSPDFVWMKARTLGSANHGLFDIVRGATKRLISNSTGAESTQSQTLTAFNSDGFDLGTDSAYNGNTYPVVGWAWDAGTSNTTVDVDANGSGLPGAACEYRANTTTGFSVVKVANPTSTETRVHGLNKKPDLIICKSTASADSWHTYHSSLGYTKYINLNGSGGAATSDQFGSQEPTSTYFYVKSATGSGANKSGGMIYYIWTAVEGYSAFGSYTGNGGSNGPFVALSFRPAFLLIKRSDGTGTWLLYDNKREGYNFNNDPLYPNLSDVEGTTDYIDLLSNGFKVRNTHGNINSSTGTYIYAAFAEHPFKTTRAR